MPAFLPTADAPATVNFIVASYPGSGAPHYRVQVLGGETQPQWRLFSTFADQSLAQICLERLRRNGESARLIAFRRVATAA
jgi:hypothetical protein